eukprot:scaffold47912_cov73-Phaeocystis_antarctica.AAC.8
MVRCSLMNCRPPTPRSHSRSLGGRWVAPNPWRWSRSHECARKASRAAVLMGGCPRPAASDTATLGGE